MEQHPLSSLFDLIAEVVYFFTLLFLKNENTDLNLKLNQAFKLASLDLKVKESLIEKIEKATTDAAIAEAKQNSALKTVNIQKAEILNLLNLSEQNAGLTICQNYNLNEMKRENENLCETIKSLQEEIDQLKSKLGNFQSKENESNKLVEEG